MQMSLSTVFDVATRANRSRYVMFRYLFSSSNVSTKKYFCRHRKGQTHPQPSCARPIWRSPENGTRFAVSKGRDSRYLMDMKKLRNINASHLFRLPFRVSLQHVGSGNGNCVTLAKRTRGTKSSL